MIIEQLRKRIKRILPESSIVFLKNLITMERLDIIEKNSSTLLQETYQEVAGDIDQKAAFYNHEFKVYSKHGNDGLILYIFSKVGTTNHCFVELGIQDGKECNTANLSLNFGWNGLLVEAKKEFVTKANLYYQKMLEKRAPSVKIVQCFVTAENINKVLLDNGIRGEIDLLSIDIDGNDYWVWKAITAINPRVVVIEYNASLGTDKPITIPYNPNFKMPFHSFYHGASLPALTKLANSKDYMLIGCDSHGHDAFFIRKDVAEGKLTELSAEDAFYPQPNRLKKFGSIEKQFERIKHLNFEHV